MQSPCEVALYSLVTEAHAAGRALHGELNLTPENTRAASLML